MAKVGGWSSARATKEHANRMATIVSLILLSMARSETPPVDGRNALGQTRVGRRIAGLDAQRHYSRPDRQRVVFFVVDGRPGANLCGDLVERQRQHRGGFQLLFIRLAN